MYCEICAIDLYMTPAIMVTKEGIFCSQRCAEEALERVLDEERLEDPSWAEEMSLPTPEELFLSAIFGESSLSA